MQKGRLSHAASVSRQFDIELVATGFDGESEWRSLHAAILCRRQKLARPRARLVVGWLDHRFAGLNRYDVLAWRDAGLPPCGGVVIATAVDLANRRGLIADGIENHLACRQRFRRQRDLAIDGSQPIATTTHEGWNQKQGSDVIQVANWEDQLG